MSAASQQVHRGGTWEVTHQSLAPVYGLLDCRYQRRRAPCVRQDRIGDLRHSMHVIRVTASHAMVDVRWRCQWTKGHIMTTTPNAIASMELIAKAQSGD